KSQSVDSLKAEVCPWEAQEVEPTDKAEICPWEAAAPSTSKEKPRKDKGSLSIVSRSPPTSQGLLKEIGDSKSTKKEKASRDRESICPWESTDTEGTSIGYGMKSTELLKATAKKSVESLKAEVCPWEAQEVEPTAKAEICPWEAAAPSTSKEKPRKDKGSLSIVSRSPPTS
ncbi:GP179 protein, partial [Fregata magnificens]|nr:GP179 protein [Fregata magnificens]